MAEEKSVIGGVKVELKLLDGRSNFTLWQQKMKNFLIRQDLHTCILGGLEQSSPWRDIRSHLKMSVAFAFITDSSVLRNVIVGFAIKISFRDNTAGSAVAIALQSKNLRNNKL